MKPLLLFVLVVGMQGALTRLLPAQVTPPDLFLLLAVAIALRAKPLPALLAAYALGLMQDALGPGLLGLHAAALAGGVLLVLGVRRFLADASLVQTLVTVTIAVAGQWATFLILTYWTRSNLVTIDVLSRVLPSMLILTLVFAPLVERFARWAFGARPSAEESFA